MQGKPHNGLEQIYFVPTALSEIRAVRDFLHEQLNRANIRSRRLREAKVKDIASLQSTVWEIRICRYWLKQLVSAERMAEFTYRNPNEKSPDIKARL